MLFENTIITVISLSTPLIIAVIGETISEKSGVINLSAEGTIMISALAGFAFGYITDIAFIGFLAGMLSGALIASFISYCDIKLRMDQIAVGFVLTILCIDLSNYLGQDYVRINGPMVTKFSIPLLSNIPIIGEILFNHSFITYFSILLIPTSWFFLNKTNIGLSIRASGENPLAASSRGINVKKMRMLGTIIGGSLLGLAGASFSLYTKYGWSESHTANYGWIILAIVIFGGWKPYRTAFGAIIFGFLEALVPRLQTYGFELSPYLLRITPYLITIIVLVVLTIYKEGETGAPRNIGKPFFRENR